MGISSGSNTVSVPHNQLAMFIKCLRFAPLGWYL